MHTYMHVEKRVERRVKNAQKNVLRKKDAQYSQYSAVQYSTIIQKEEKRKGNKRKKGATTPLSILGSRERWIEKYTQQDSFPTTNRYATCSCGGRWGER